MEHGADIEAYRGQSRAEAAFRDFRDPGMLATRPQFHWTDQKLHVHTFMCVTAYLLLRLLLRRAQRKTDFAGCPRKLIAELTRIRRSRLIERTGRAGRPRVRFQLEEMTSEVASLGEALRAMPATD